MPLKLLSSGGGSVLLTANTTAADFTVNVPAVNGNMVTTADTGSISQSMLGAGVYAGYGPAFSVYLGTDQSISQSTWTRVNFNTKEFDTATAFNTSTYRFQPTIAGYYQLSAGILFNVAVNGYNYMGFWKNGSTYRYSASMQANQLGDITLNSSMLVYFNGSTDYMEVWGYSGATSPTFNGGIQRSFFSGFLARAA